ncbi:hypothetical protein EVG20_g10047, partial [Dentipellis fragilis]
MWAHAARVCTVVRDSSVKRAWNYPQSIFQPRTISDAVAQINSAHLGQHHDTIVLHKLKLTAQEANMSAHNFLSPLERLNDDVLALIVNALCTVDPYERNMKQLSLASKRLRTVCLPILFEKARIYGNSSSHLNIPPASWPYVRTMVIDDSFATTVGYDMDKLHQTLPHLVALRKIVFDDCSMGVSWMDLQLFLTAPRVRMLEIQASANFLPQDFSFEGNMPLLPFTEFIYSIDDPGHLNWYELRTPIPIARWCYMSPLILSLHQTLELLHIPAAMAPVSEMATMDWPCLRELKLYGPGHFGSKDAVVFAHLCLRMPRLRVLNFDFLHRGPSSQTLIWPSDVSFPTSFEHMEMVCLHYPDPKDMFYSHLPSTLRHLSLIDCPRYLHFQNGQAEVIENYPRPVLVAARDLLHIFKQMSFPIHSLVHLEIAFHADGLDRALFNHIKEDNADIESLVIDLMQNLSVLQALCHFRVYLDLPDDKPRSTVSHGEHRSDERRHHFGPLALAPPSCDNYRTELFSGIGDNRFPYQSVVWLAGLEEM